MLEVIESDFARLGVRLKACKVGLDHFQHANNTAVFRLHALVLLVENLWLLHKGSGLGGLGIKLLEDSQCLSHSCLCFLGILDGLRVLGLLLLAKLGCLGHGCIKLGHCFGQLTDVLSEFSNRGLELINLGVEGLDSLSLLLARLLVGGELSVAPALVLCLLVGLFHQADNEV